MGSLGEGRILLFNPVCQQVELLHLCSSLLTEESTSQGPKRISGDTIDQTQHKFGEQQVGFFTISLYSG